jgi:hypothetical protein
MIKDNDALLQAYEEGRKHGIQEERSRQRELWLENFHEVFGDASKGYKSEVEYIESRIRHHAEQLDELESSMKEKNGIDLGTVSGWLKLLPYIILGAIAIGSLILQGV